MKTPTFIPCDGDHNEDFPQVTSAKPVVVSGFLYGSDVSAVTIFPTHSCELGLRSDGMVVWREKK